MEEEGDKQNGIKQQVCHCKTNRTFIYILAYSLLVVIFSEVYLSFYVYSLRNELSSKVANESENYGKLLKELETLKDSIQGKVQEKLDEFQQQNKTRRKRLSDHIHTPKILEDCCKSLNDVCTKYHKETNHQRMLGRQTNPENDPNYAKTDQNKLIRIRKQAETECDCPPGPPGIKGERGFPGLAGPEGLQGMPGPPGSPGIEGRQGTDGVPGLVGPIGPPGVKGERGASAPDEFLGLRGPKGEKGERGSEGLPGAPGLRGADGIAGPRGPFGPPGEKGERGFSGLSGPPGQSGAQGIPGRDGSRGKPGDDGYPGLPGTPGKDGTLGPGAGIDLSSLKGQKGERGYPGRRMRDSKRTNVDDEVMIGFGYNPQFD